MAGEGKGKTTLFLTERMQKHLPWLVYMIMTNRETGEILETFTVITTRANPLLEKIHNTKKRMPVILKSEDEKIWIDPDLPLERTLSFLAPYKEELMHAEEVEKKLFARKSAEEDPALF
jgi:putative SOS response-associated peptidase YedK